MYISWISRNKTLAVSILLVGLFSVLLLQVSISASPVPTLGTELLTEKAIEAAQSHGLNGPPEAQTIATMTLKEWNDLIDAELGVDAAKYGLTPDMPVFVLAIKGSVDWAGPGLRPPGQKAPEHFNNMTVVLNAQTGEVIWTGSKREGYPMPVPVP